MRRRLFGPVGPVATIVLAVGACTAPRQDVITRSYLAPTYGPTTLSAARKYDATPVDIAGNPFPVPDNLVKEHVVEAVNGAGAVGNQRFAAEGTDPRNPYRLVVLFQPSTTIGHPRVCRGARTQAEDPGPGVEMMLTYCLGKKALSSLRARQSGFDGPDDPAFRRFLRNAMSALFPPRNEIRRNGGRDGNNGFF